ncbi:MAG: chromosome segregation protein, partial [Polymorphobacter sp.]
DGRLWRWDGFRAFGGEGAATAERFIARNRLETVRREVDVAQGAEADQRLRRDAAERTLADGTTAAHAAREARNRAEARLAAARTEQAARSSAVQRRTGEMAALSEAVARISQDATGHRREAAEAAAAAELVVDLAALAEAGSLARQRAEAARQALTSARAGLAVVMRDDDAAQQRQAIVDREQADWAKRQAASNTQQAALLARADALAVEAAQLAALPPVLARRQADIADAMATAETAREVAAAALVAAEAGLRAVEVALRAGNEQLAAQREARATAVANAGHADLRCSEVTQLALETFGCQPSLLPARQGFAAEAAGDSENLRAALEVLVAERERIGPVNLRAEIELEELLVGQTSSIAEREELETAIARLRGSIGALNREGRVRLLEAFKAVDSNFRELFSTLFVGGAARLELIESDDPLESGLEIMAQPPGKKLQSLTLLSGGEQALTAVALIFALFLTNPAPICVLDEVDAPLDDANVERFCDLLDRMAATTATRFLIVTHNAVTMSRMHRLYGVTMAEQGVSQLVSVDLARAGLLLAAQ